VIADKELWGKDRFEEFGERRAELIHSFLKVGRRGKGQLGKLQAIPKPNRVILLGSLGREVGTDMFYLNLLG
jgi:hypothetical protein